MHTRDGTGVLIDPNTIPRDDLSPERAALLDTWIDADKTLKDATAFCDECSLSLTTAIADRNEHVRRYARRFAISFMDQWRNDLAGHN